MKSNIVKRNGSYSVKYCVNYEQKWQGGFKTVKAAEAWRDEIKTDIRSGRYRELKPDISFAEYVSKWTAEKRSQVKPGTMDFYRAPLAHLVKAFGHKSLRSLEYGDIKAYVTAKVEEGSLSAASISKHLMTVRQILSEAVREDYLAQNVALLVKPPRQQKKEFTALSPEQLGLFLSVVDSRYKLLFEVLILTGCRVGEALPLQWQHIDFTGSTVTISRSVRNGVISDTKTASSRRTLALPKYLASALATEKLRRGCGEDDLVFVSSAGTMIDLNNLRKNVFQPALRLADLPQIRVHDLRHASATLALRNGESLADVAARLGHSKVSTTLNFYSHALADSKHDQAEKLAGVLLGQK